MVSYSASSADDTRIRLATTTSTYDSGLFDYLRPKFEQDTGYKVDVIATGTGKALKMGENGDVDLVMTHAPKAEASFVEAGFGVLPRKLMYNDFVVFGPESDPAKLRMKRTSQKYLKIFLKAARCSFHAVMTLVHIRKSSAFGHKTKSNQISFATVPLVKVWVQY